MSEPSKLPTRDMSALLMAVIDGEADAADRARAFAAVAADPKLATVAEAFRLTGRSMGGLFDGVLAEPVPGQLAHTVRTTEAAKLAPGRAIQQKASWLGWLDAWRLPAAVLTASAIAFAAGNMLSAFGPQQVSQVVASNSVLLTDAALGRGLSEVSSGAEREVVNGPVSIKIKVVESFRGHGGEFCREYEAQGSSGSRQFGVACMSARGWEVKAMLIGNAKSARQTITAGEELATALDDIAGRLKDGDALGVDDERKLIAGGWRLAR